MVGEHPIIFLMVRYVIMETLQESPLIMLIKGKSLSEVVENASTPNLRLLFDPVTMREFDYGIDDLMHSLSDATIDKDEILNFVVNVLNVSDEYTYHILKRYRSDRFNILSHSVDFSDDLMGDFEFIAKNYKKEDFDQFLFTSGNHFHREFIREVESNGRFRAKLLLINPDLHQFLT